jgi:hypothetical protein
MPWQVMGGLAFTDDDTSAQRHSRFDGNAQICHVLAVPARDGNVKHDIVECVLVAPHSFQRSV